MALHGLAGRWVEATQPFTESHPAGVLVSTLIGFGSAIGRSPYVQVGASEHHAHDFAVLVGPTAVGRKGDAMNLGLRPIRLADPDWDLRVVRGFGSGEQLIAEVADTDDDGQPNDKRLLVHEDELAHPLAVAGREGSTLSTNMRNAWDGRRLENRTRSGKLIATGAHVGVLAAITPEELLRRCPETEVANGFLNRFLIAAVRRVRLLPNGRPLDGALETDYATAFRDALMAARKIARMRRDPAADEIWADSYERELSVERQGLAGAACSRAEAHALRLSMLYALLDESDVIRGEHVQAALALWRYCEESALLIFGDLLGDQDADTILDALEVAGAAGLTRTEIWNLFSRHRTKPQIDATLARLLAGGRVVLEQGETGGRPVSRYWLAEYAKEPRGAPA